MMQIINRVDINKMIHFVPENTRTAHTLSGENDGSADDINAGILQIGGPEPLARAIEQLLLERSKDRH